MPFSNGSGQATRSSFFVVVVVALACLLGSQLPVIGLAFLPVDLFVTTLHEFGHALACVFTGGQVVSVTIVPDASLGAAGVTTTIGGLRFLTIQAGYLGASIAAALLLWLSSVRTRSNATLVGLGAFLGVGSLLFMGWPMLAGQASGSIGLSLVLGLAMSAAFIFAGKRLSSGWAQALLMFLSVQSAFNALSDIWFLVKVSFFSGGAGVHSDAHAMATLTGVPAVLWAALWGAISIGLLWLTVKRSFDGAPATSDNTEVK